MDKRQATIIFLWIAASLAWISACSPSPAPSPALSPTALPASTATMIPRSTQSPTPTRETSPSPTPARCTETEGQVEIHEFDAVSLPSYHIYLPPCYGFDPETRYPVLYLLHGANYTDDQWLRLGATEGNPNFIIVMPFNKYSLRLVDDDEFGEIFIEDFLPFIDEAYLTRDEAKYRAIGGLSRGGGWAIHYGFTRWALFGAVGAHSPAIFYKDHNKLEKWLAEIPADAMPRLFVDVGDKDQELNSVISFEAILNAQNIPHQWHLYTGFHDENYWAAHTREYLAWYAAGFED